MLAAVITGDIVHSTALAPLSEKKLLKDMRRVLEPYKYEFYRGDSFQVYLNNATDALRTVFLLRCVALRIEQEAERFDIKTSIGLGSIKQPVKDLAMAKGSAFLLSGRQFDNADWTNKRMIITIDREPMDTALDMLTNYADDIFDRMTSKQAAVVFELLMGKTQEQIAKQFDKAQSTISKQVAGGRWDKIQDLLVKFDHFIQLMKL